jgi:hypothetical protein
VTLFSEKRAGTRSTTQKQTKPAPQDFSFSFELIPDSPQPVGQEPDTQGALLRAFDPQS